MQGFFFHSNTTFVQFQILPNIELLLYQNYKHATHVGETKTDAPFSYANDSHKNTLVVSYTLTEASSAEFPAACFVSFL